MHFTSLKGILNLVVYGGIYTLIYCCIAYFISMNKYEKDIVNKVLIKFHMKKM